MWPGGVSRFSPRRDSAYPLGQERVRKWLTGVLGFYQALSGPPKSPGGAESL